MATPESSSSSSSTECPACLEYFEIPKLLPCLHTFCLRCVKKFQREDKTSVIHCPVCRAEHELPIGRENELVDDFSVPCTKKKSQKCQLCVEKHEAVSSCKDCRFVLCSKCTELHRILIPFQHHVVRPIGEEDKPLLRNPLCAYHNFEQLLFYCSTCQLLVCVYCVVHDHRDHTIANCLGEAFQEQLHLLSVPHGLIIDKSQAIRNEMKDWTNFENFFEDHISGLRSAVEKDASMLIKAVNERKRQIFEQIDEIDTTIKKQVWAAKNAEEFKLESMQATINFSDRMSHCNRDVYLYLTSQLSKRFKDISDLTIDRKAMKDTSSKVPLLSHFISKGNITKALDLTMPRLESQYGDINFIVQISSEITPGAETKANFVLQSKKVDITKHLQHLSVAVLYGKDFSRLIIAEKLVGVSGTLAFRPVCGGNHLLALIVAGIVIQCISFSVSPGDPPSNKVRRGPDWCYGNLTVPINATGVITRPQTDNQLQVRWNNGISDKYRWGLDDCYDVELILL